MIPWVCILNRLFWDIDVSQLSDQNVSTRTCERDMGGERHRHVVSSEDGSEEEDVCQGGESVFGRVM